MAQNAALYHLIWGIKKQEGANHKKTARAEAQLTASIVAEGVEAD